MEKEKVKRELTDSIFYSITANGMREMDEIRFYQACQELIDAYEREKVMNNKREYFKHSKEFQ